jgi:hypothetical protein
VFAVRLSIFIVTISDLIAFVLLIVGDTMVNFSSDEYQDPWHKNICDECNEIEGKKFISLKKFPRFRSSTLAPNTVEFKDGKVYYGYGCAVESGSITCEVNDIFVSISAITDVNSNRFTGKYNRNTKRLIWQDEEYVESNNAY